jgi:SulP family sulfate permease
MAGCAMIGQSIINVKSGGRGRLSTFCAGAFLLFMIVVLGDWVKQIPMAALVAIMIMVSIGTFSWSSIKSLRVHPRSSSIVMIATVATVVYTHNLAIGVAVGVLMSAVSFARKAARLVRIGTELGADGESRTYFVEGNLFFVSAGQFARSFNFREALARVTIDVTRAHFWDITSVAALDKVVLKFRRNGAEVNVVGLNEASATLVERVASLADPDLVLDVRLIGVRPDDLDLVPSEMERELDRLSAKLGRSRSDVVRDALWRQLSLA